MKVLQVNCVYDYGSTGKITKALHECLTARGIESVVVYGRRQKTDERGKTPCADRTNRASLSRYRKQHAGGMNFCKVIVSDLIEKNTTPEQNAAHIDIAG